ncbi:MAG: glycosyl hydrolase [Candidatus Neomarinimicrobiota bacterium]|nr:glycosyl hydrolase [Candidatus Neomarinimicrobiota bacterium]
MKKILNRILIFSFCVLSADSLDVFFKDAMMWRNIGPFRGGRSLTAVGVPSKPLTYYFGSVGGGVWKTEDAGLIWKNISDGYFKTGSVGALAVSESDPNVVYVGMGEACIRPVMTSHGDGVYRSNNGGETWDHIGLDNSRTISSLVIHPKDHNLVYVGVQGDQYKPSKDRGVYRSFDGGENWEKVLYINETSGVSGISMDRNNPRILYVSFWDHLRKPWQMRSGGEGSGIYKSTDSGTTWTKLSKGLPSDMGKTDVSVSGANSKRVYVIAEAEKGGLFRSDNGGKSFKRVNSDRTLIARSWYYIHVFADPQDENIVYVLNAPFMKSTDGGNSFDRISVPHGDNHGLWINPENNKNMINANDGGANISFNGGQSWSTQKNQPTAQFYRVITDNRFPYYVYAGQQDNSSVAVPNRTTGRGIDWSDWYSAAGCESAYLAFDPDNPVEVYGGCYQGLIEKLNVMTRKRRSIMAYEFLGLGSVPRDQKFRFNWNAPIVASPHDPSTIYHAGNVLFKTNDGGDSWNIISPDLTKNDVKKHDLGSIPFTNEAAGGEIYNTIMYLVESKNEKGVIWTGSDDGLVYLTKDGGGNWKNITPKGMGEGIVNTIELSPHDEGTAYVAFTKYKFGDLSPSIYKTTNYGKSWTKRVSGIDDDAFVRVVREDPIKKNLLYAGTETGLYLSRNGGKSWEKFQLNLPVVPITDLTIRNNDLVASTQGRSFWILDDLTQIHQYNSKIKNEYFHLFKPSVTYRTSGGSSKSNTIGQNPPNGAVILYYFQDELSKDTNVKLEILEGEKIIRTITNKSGESAKTFDNGRYSSLTLSTKKGVNRFIWNFRVDDITMVKDVSFYGSYSGYRVGPGNYTLRLTVGDNSMEQNLLLNRDPRLDIKDRDNRAHQQMMTDLYNQINDLHSSIVKVRNIRSQIQKMNNELEDMDNMEEILEAGKKAINALDKWEGNVLQTKMETFQDVVNFLNRLNSHMINLLGTIDGSDPPLTQGQVDRYSDLSEEWNNYEKKLNEIINNQISSYNELYRLAGLPAIIIKD